MYVQITTRCNMTCEHCCFACVAKGDTMSLSTFRKALDFVTDYDEHVAIGGGEPTIHPNFWEILGLSIGQAEYVWLSTNGSRTKTALALAKLAEKDVIGCQLSLTPYHDPIDDRVVEAFNESKGCNVNYGSEHVGMKLSNSGRCDWGEDRCCCPGTFIRPTGAIHVCGCSNSPEIGHVNEGGLYDSVNDLTDKFDCSYG